MTDHHGTCHHGVYGLTCAGFEALWERAGGKCEICGTAAADTPRHKLCIDHDPRYGFEAVRGLLCDRCNSLMSFVDRGRKRDPRAYRYYARAWFLAQPERPAS